MPNTSTNTFSPLYSAVAPLEEISVTTSTASGTASTGSTAYRSQVDTITVDHTSGHLQLSQTIEDNNVVIADVVTGGTIDPSRYSFNLGENVIQKLGDWSSVNTVEVSYQTNL